MLACTSQSKLPERIAGLDPQERHFILVIDGARYSETFGDSTYAHILTFAETLAEGGRLYTQCFNEGPTKTIPGHTALITGHYQKIDNTGLEFPDNPSIFQRYLAATGLDSTKAVIIGSKNKLFALGNSRAEWKDRHRPYLNVGRAGRGLRASNRTDSMTLAIAQRIIKEHDPHLGLIQFKEPDVSGHRGNYDEYIAGLERSHRYAVELWRFLQLMDEERGTKTTLYVTNDHGRHLDGVKVGFVNHGCDCLGCRQIELAVFDPHLDSLVVDSTHISQKDIHRLFWKDVGE